MNSRSAEGELGRGAPLDSPTMGGPRSFRGSSFARPGASIAFSSIGRPQRHLLSQKPLEIAMPDRGNVGSGRAREPDRIDPTALHQRDVARHCRELRTARFEDWLKGATQAILLMPLVGEDEAAGFGQPTIRSTTSRGDVDE
jgi:hypothetical protein